MSPSSGLGQQDQLMHWLSIVKIFNSYLHVLRANHVGAKGAQSSMRYPFAVFQKQC
jgi:hypothetical protein